MSPAQEAQYTAILQAQQALLGAGNAALTAAIGAQISSLNSFSASNSTLLDELISEFTGLQEQTDVLTEGKTTFQSHVSSLVSSLQIFSGSADDAIDDAVQDLQDIIDGL